MYVSEDAWLLLNLLNRDGSGYLVGGCVRDFVMNCPSHDEDIATSLTPVEVESLLQKSGLPVIGVGKRFGTVNTQVNGHMFEVTTFRKESGYSDSRHPDMVQFTRNLEEDAARRDFTCNAMYYDVRSGEIIDLYGGQEDIRRGVLRTVGDANDRFREDALRMLRAVRICSEKGFSLDESVFNAIRDNKDLIHDVSVERQASEISRILMSDRPVFGFKVLYDCGLLKEVLPEVDAMYSCYQNNPWHMSTVFDHTMRAVECAPKDLVVRWSLLLHDTGKVRCKTTDVNGVDHFLGHAKVSSKITMDVLNRLHFPNSFSSAVEFCVRNHDERFVKHYQRNAVKMYVRQYGQYEIFEKNYERLLSVQAADVQAHSDALDKETGLCNIKMSKEVFDSLFSRPHLMSDLSVDGHDMLEFGVFPKEINMMKQRLLCDVLQQPKIPDRDWQLKYIRKNAKMVHDLYEKREAKDCVELSVKRNLPSVSKSVGILEKDICD